MEYLLPLLGMGIVTYLPRLIPLFFLTKRQLPPWLEEGLAFLPAAILGALVLPLVILPGGAREISLIQPHFIAAIPTIIVALTTRSLAATVLAGMGSFWLVKLII